MAPIWTVRRPSDVGIVIGRVLSGGSFRAVGYGGVVGFKEGPGHFDGGADNDGVGAKPDMHDGSILLGESMEGPVRK